MTLRQYLTVMIIATLLCWSSWAVVVMNIDPYKDNGAGLLFFYITLFFSLIGTVSLFVFLLLYYFSRERYAVFYDVQRSFVIALATSGLGVLLLFMHDRNVLNIWNLLIFVFVVVFLVLFKISTSSYHKNA